MSTWRIRHDMSAWSAAAVWMAASMVAAGETRIVVDAGSHDRRNVLVGAEIPATTAKSVTLRGRDGSTIVGQLHGGTGDESTVMFVLPRLAAGQKAEYLVETSDAPSEKKYRWEQNEPEMQLRDGDKLVLQYICPTFDPKNVEGTKKPFHHVFDPNGSGPITKGAGGLYPHHRGLFVGYRACTAGSATVDTWHARNGEHEQHRKVGDTREGPVVGGHTVHIDWNGRDGRTFLKETRSVDVLRLSDDRLLIELNSILSPTGASVELGGDRQHSGVQFRAAQSVADRQKETRFLRPGKWASLDPSKEENGATFKDLPWDAMEYTLGDRRYTVAYLSHPKNPEGGDFSERSYGRIGEYIPLKISKGDFVVLSYQILVGAGPGNGPPPLTREEIERAYADFASPPETTVVESSRNK